MATNDSTPRTIEIQLTKGYVALVDEQDADLALFKWHVTTSGAYVIYATRRNYSIGKEAKERMHRVILERKIGRPLAQGEYCDHENNNALDNRRSNLRVASKNDNAHNRQISKNNTSGYKGVYFQRGRWRSIIIAYGKRIHLGYYSTASEAHKAYCEAAVKYHGEFAKFR